MEARDLMELVATEYGTTVKELKGSKRNPPLPEARRMASLLLSKEGLSFREISKELNFHWSNLPAFVRQAEDEVVLYQRVREVYDRVLNAISNGA